MKKIATRQAYGEALEALGHKNKDVVVLDADLSKSTKTAIFQSSFPERHINVGIAEADLIGTAAGLAAAGKVAFASTFAVFAAGRAFEQIRNTVAYPKLNVKVCATHAGITVGEDGGSHQSIEDLALMRTIPGMTVLCPADAEETKQMIEAVAEMDGPAYVRLGRLNTPVLFDEDYKFKIGKAVTLKEGTDLTICATGMLVAEAVEAANLLEREGISVRVLNFGTIKPIDKEAVIKAAKETKFILTAEEHSVIGGLGGAVAEVTAEECPARVVRMGIYDRFGESGKGDELLEKFEFTAPHMIKKIKVWMSALNK